MKSSSKISVIIPTFNSWYTLKSCINSIYKQTLKPLEIIVIDNASSDGTAKKVRQYYPKVNLVVLPTNLGVTGGRNAGIDYSNKKSKYLFFFDHDMSADKNMLKNLVGTLNSDHNIGITTPKIYYSSHKRKIWSAGTNINLITGQVLFRGGDDIGQFNLNEQVQVAPAAIMVKRSVIDQIGGFDNRYFLTYEDTDFCFRTRDKGFKTLYTPKAIAYHKISLNRSLSNKRLLARSYWVARNRILFMKDYAWNFYFFLLLSPIYLLYFLTLAISERNFSGFLNFVKGYIIGIIEVYIGFELSVMHFSTFLPWTYPSLIKKLIPPGSSVLDVGCGDGNLMKWINTKGEYKVVGMDINSSELEIAKSRTCLFRCTPVYQDVITKNFTKGVSIKKKFDVVVCSQVVEHLKKDQAIKLIKQMEKLTYKRVVVATINGFFEFDTHIQGEYDRHISGWSVKEFIDLGYEVMGSGLKFIYKPGALKDILPKFFRPLLFLISYLLTPMLSFFISPALFLIAYKDVKKA